MALTREDIAQKRDKKVREALGHFAPVWLVAEEFRAREDSLIFHVVFEDPSYGWMNRRYKYDGFNDVLYHLGWRALTEAETLTIQEAEPYIGDGGDVAQHVPNSPAFRTSNIGLRPR